MYTFCTRQIPAGQGCANRRHCHFMRRQLEYVVDTSQFRHSLDGHFQAGDTIITIGTFFQRFSKKSVKTGSSNRPALSINLTFRRICKNHVLKVSIASSTCPGFIYQSQKSIIFRTEPNRTERKHQFGGTHERKKRFAPKKVKKNSKLVKKTIFDKMLVFYLILVFNLNFG